MPKPPRPERAEALRRLAAGDSVADVARDLDVPPGTVRSWRRRAEQQGVTPANPPPPDSPPKAPKAPKAPPPVPLTATARHGRLVDAPRPEYLADRIAFLEDVVRDAAAGDGPVPGSSIAGLVKLQADLHAARDELLRTEGSRLDLSASPRQLAMAVLRVADPLRVLAVPVDLPDDD